LCRRWDLLGGEVDDLARAADSSLKRFSEINIDIGGRRMLSKSNSISPICDSRDDLFNREKLAFFVALVEVLTQLPPSLNHDIRHIPASFFEFRSSSRNRLRLVLGDEFSKRRVVGEIRNPLSGIPGERRDLTRPKSLREQQGHLMMRVPKPLHRRHPRPLWRAERFHIFARQVSDRPDGSSPWDLSFSQHISTFAKLTFIRLSRECLNSRSVSLQCLNRDRPLEALAKRTPIMPYIMNRLS